MTNQKVWLITGCSAGLGWALASHVLNQGQLLIATSRNPANTPALVEEVESKGGKWFKLDVTDETSISQVFATIKATYGSIDVLVNNAGYAVMGAIEDTPVSQVQDQMDVNFLGPLRLMQAALPGMRQRGSGVIINVSSAQGLCPSPANGIYAASKAALEAASESLGQEVSQFGIRVNLIELGAFKTTFGSLGSRVMRSSQAYMIEGHPVAARLAWLPKLTEIAPGDPDKAARAIFEVADAGKCEHFRVILGLDCWKRVDGKATELRRTVDAQETLAASTDF
jgi:NAD(P)-dependent dehydrogenase (short-subunit alcohol dehydrogenase family)